MIRPAWMFINLEIKWTTEMSCLIPPPSKMHSTDVLDTVGISAFQFNTLLKQNGLKIDHTRQFLDPVQQEVSLLNGCLVKSILSIRAVSFKNACNFINLTMKFPSCDKTR